MRFIDTQWVDREDVFKFVFKRLQTDLVTAKPVDIGEWQSQKIDQPMHELFNVCFTMPIPETDVELAKWTGAHLPWAEDHFQERVSGQPLNPPPSEEYWPFAQKVNRAHKSEEGGKFSHTYPERFWPKQANPETLEPGARERFGIRFEYGDLQDVVNQLTNSSHTRQAYLPIFFPEDTGAVHGKRVPCTLGYQFTIRKGALHITYFMRSTDLLRHFQDDIYLAGRLAQWVVREINNINYEEYEESFPLKVGTLTFHTVNMHIFAADVEMINYRMKTGQIW